MKVFTCLIIALLLFSGCGTPNTEDLAYQDQEVVEERKKPKLPESERKKPKLPLKASVLDALKERPKAPDETKLLLAEIDKEIEQANISEEDIRRGWYYGLRTDEKYGTPETWVWIDDGEKSRWASSYSVEEDVKTGIKELCGDTAGTYVLSCLDDDTPNCQYVAKSECICIEGSKWNEESGCLLTSKEGEFISISRGELSQGWYKGLPNEKKLNTPANWIWVEDGEDSKWKKPQSL